MGPAFNPDNLKPFHESLVEAIEALVHDPARKITPFEVYLVCRFIITTKIPTNYDEIENALVLLCQNAGVSGEVSVITEARESLMVQKREVSSE